MKPNPLEEELKKELPNLWYIGLFNPKVWKSGDFVPGEELSWFETLSEDIEDPNIPCEEKRKALTLLWKNVKEFLKEDYIPLTYDPNRPKIHWWWHPELWNGDLNPFEVLKGNC